ncbi:Fc.00g107090.m01.CDS01 [Cosmosporella sp. VM-42]
MNLFCETDEGGSLANTQDVLRELESLNRDECSFDFDESALDRVMRKEAEGTSVFYPDLKRAPAYSPSKFLNVYGSLDPIHKGYSEAVVSNLTTIQADTRSPASVDKSSANILSVAYNSLDQPLLKLSEEGGPFKVLLSAEDPTVHVFRYLLELTCTLLHEQSLNGVPATPMVGITMALNIHSQKLVFCSRVEEINQQFCLRGNVLSGLQLRSEEVLLALDVDNTHSSQSLTTADIFAAAGLSPAT